MMKVSNSEKSEVNMFFNRSLQALVCGLVTTFCASPVQGQCQSWSTEFTNSSPQGGVLAMQTFDDGSGSALWVAGGFSQTCCPAISTDSVAKWNGHTWQAAGAQLNDLVESLAVYDSGSGPSIYAGGYFRFLTGERAIARWNGSAWVPVGGGMTGPSVDIWVQTMASFDAGQGSELYLGGNFTGAGGVSSLGIIKWNGSAWSPLGTGLGGVGSNNPTLYAMTVFDDGSGPALYVGGIFGSAGGMPASSIARWNGTSWSALGSGAADVYAFAAYDDGSGPALYAAGAFPLSGGGYAFVARWNGSTWVPLPSQLDSGAYALLSFDDGSGPALFAGGTSFSAGGHPAKAIARWDGTNWFALGGGLNSQPLVECLASYDDGSGGGPNLYVGGSFTQAGGGIASRGIAKWISCHGPIDSICPGDNTLAACPCMNGGLPHHGCDNSVASGGARLYTSGTTSPDSLVLTSAGELPSALSIFLQGDALAPYAIPFGDGLRCAGGHLLRLYVKAASNSIASAPQSGDASVSARSATLGDSLATGMVRYYQTYYRDPDPNFCPNPPGGTFNASNALRVVW